MISIDSVIYLFLDNLREPKNSNLYIVRTYEECVEFLDTNSVEFMSLAHDLGSKKTGYDVVKFMVQFGIKVPHINIHSANPVGCANMTKLIKQCFPPTYITYDKNI